MIFSEALSKCDKNQKVIVSSENRRTHKAHNDACSKVFQFKIDGDIEPTGTSDLRCDYIIENETKKTIYPIELKGSDIAHAVEQINATLERYSSSFSDYAIFPRIVCSRVTTHAIRTSKVIVFKKHYPKLIIKENIIEENI